jgi:hypothetical protein
MTIQVPFRLRRRSWAEPATAVFVSSRSALALLAPCAQLGLDPSACVFDVARGYLVTVERPLSDRSLGDVRLRALVPGFYLPVDADLVPSLLVDEAEGLVRDWGLVFLPSGRALLFDRHAPVELTQLLKAHPRPRRAWSTFPQPRRLADRLAQIALERPEPPPEALYSELKRQVRGSGAHPETTRQSEMAGSHDDADIESADQSAADDVENAPKGAAGPGVGAAARNVLAGLGTAARAMFAQAGHTLAGLSEKAQWDWVDHSALLRKLVQEFRDGDPERALRRAVPIASADDPTLPVPAAGLPWSRPIYNLAELLKRPRRGEATPVLHAQPGVMDLLAQEYQKAARRALERGDFRRAAYIHGVLLRDDRQAAIALGRGGLHHDAAILFLQKLNDRVAAAQAFEAAGAVDRALAIYRQLGRHEAAGDLLRRIGDEDGATAEYSCAAQALVGSSPPDHLAAGRLWLAKARNADRAIEQFQMGWDRRPLGNAALCGLELARFHAQRGAVEPIWKLLDEADLHFGAPGQPFDGFFYNEITRLASLPSMDAAADDLRDRTLQSLVQKLRGGIAGCQSAPALVSALLGRSKLWPAPVVSDAEFAATAEWKRSRERTSPTSRDPRIAGAYVGRGTITAVCQAAATGELFLGLEIGQVLAYRPERNQMLTVADVAVPVTGLSVDPDGRTIVVLHASDRRAVMCCFRKQCDGSFRPSPEVTFPALVDKRMSPVFPLGVDSWLTPILPLGIERLVGISDGPDLTIIDAASGILVQRRRVAADASAAPVTALLLPVGSSRRTGVSRLVVLTHEGDRWVVVDERDEVLHQTGFRWHPAAAESSTLRSVPITWRFAPPILELLGLDRDGAIHAAQFHAEDGSVELVAAQVATTEGGYLAATRSGATTIVAISRARIDWLACSEKGLHVVNKMEVGFPTAIACFASPATHETLVVCSDGFIPRLAAPRR